MSLLRAVGIAKHYGAQDVLRAVDLRIEPGEKIGLVGRNGGGKSTLLRILEGQETPDQGRLQLAKDARVGYVPQAPKFDPGVSVRAYVESGLDEVRSLAQRVERLAERMGEVAGAELERVIREHEHESERLRLAGGWEIERRVEIVLSGIGLAHALWEREARTLSGGERSRTALARELVAGHDLLLLDEPTNHLDLAGIEWIESWLHDLGGAVLVVSHDRRLLEGAVDAIVDLERGTLARYPGSFSQYVELREERYESEYRAWKQQRDEIAREESFIKKHIGSQRTAEAKGRQKKLANVVRLPQPFHDIRRPVIRPPVAARGGELVVACEGLAGGYDGKRLFSGLDLRIGRGDRIGIVGPNGAGKTTLLRILAGRQAPLAGRVERGHGEQCGYHDQDSSELDEAATILVELRRQTPDQTDLELRNHAARFLFRGNEVDKHVRHLSGGERARLALAKLVRTQPSWLALDEPTNHLDLAARTALEEMLSAFDGALVCVSHDRAFLDALCTRILFVAPEGVTTFEGNYSAWRKAREEARSAAEAVRDARPRPKPSAAAAEERPRATASSRVRNPYKFEELERNIMALEEELAELHAASATEEVFRDPERMRETAERIGALEDELASRNAEWEAWID